KVQRALSSRGRSDGNERTDFEPALAGVAVNLRVGVSQHGFVVVAQPAVEKLAIPGFVYLAGVRRGRPVRDAAGADNGNSFGKRIRRAPERFAKRPRAMQRGEGWALAVDVGGNDGNIVFRRKKVQRHTDRVVEAPL